MASPLGVRTWGQGKRRGIDRTVMRRGQRRIEVAQNTGRKLCIIGTVRIDCG